MADHGYLHGYAPRAPDYFAEYSLWNDSAYSLFTIQTMNRMELSRPVAGSIFLSPPSFDLDSSARDHAQAPMVLPEEAYNTSPGYERYMKRALKVVTRDDLLREPSLFRKDPDCEDGESSSEYALDPEVYLHPPRPRWRTAQLTHGRGRRRNLMQRRLEQALSPSNRSERGSSSMQRMGWNGSTLGREGAAVMETVQPDPYYVRMLNAAYRNTFLQPAGLAAAAGAGAGAGAGAAGGGGAEVTELGADTHYRSPTMRTAKSKKDFKVNVLQYIREFVKNDLQVEMFFEINIWGNERKRIHDIVAKLMGAENEVTFETEEMQALVRDIERRNAYKLGTQSEGVAPHRQMCIYKEAAPKQYLVTPDDIRSPPLGDNEEETNPFMRSIARHLKGEVDPPSEEAIVDRIIDFFIEFAESNQYTEFRFLGPYNMDEIDAMSSFFAMVTRMAEARPYLDYPERLVRAFRRGLHGHAVDEPKGVVTPWWDSPERLVVAFEKGNEYNTMEDPNGFLSVKKYFKLEEIEEIKD